MKPSTRKKVRASLVFTVSMLIVSGTLLVTVRSLGLRTETVASGSMEPLFTTGSRLVVKETRDVQVNDVIMFHNPDTGGITVHVYGGLNKDGTLKTRGIANEQPDSFTPAPRVQDIMGKVIWHSEIFVPAFWTTELGKMIIGAFALIVLLLGFGWWANHRDKLREATM